MDLLALINAAIIVAITLLWWGLYDAAHPPPNTKQDPFHSLAMTGMFVDGLPLVAGNAGPENLDDVLARIGRAGGYRDVPEFLDGAKQAYELIVGAFARGNVDGMAHLLGGQVKHDFQAFLEARRQRGETESLTFIGFSAADVVGASFENAASIDVRFAADVVSVTRDRDGHVIQGHPDRVARVAEVWTFERDTKSREPRWLLVATDADE